MRTRTTITLEAWLAIVHKVGTVPDTEIAKELGVGVKGVVSRRQKMGIPAWKRPKGHCVRTLSIRRKQAREAERDRLGKLLATFSRPDGLTEWLNEYK